MIEDYDPPSHPEKHRDNRGYCERNGLYCDKAQYGELGFWEKLEMWYHFLFCKSCREYQKKNSKLTKAIEKSGIRSLSKQEREALKQRVRQ